MKRILKHKVVHQFATYGVLNSLGAAIPLLSIPIITGFFTPEEYGYLGLALAIISLLSQVLQLGLTHLIAKEFHKHSQQERSMSHGLMVSLMAAAGLFTFASMLIFKPLLPWTQNLETAHLSMMILCGTSLALWFIYTTVQQFHNKAFTVGCMGILQNALIYGTVIWTLYTYKGASWDTFLICQTAVQTVLTGVALIWLFKQKELTFNFDKTQLKARLTHTLGFSLPMIPFMLGTTLMITADRMLIEHFVGVKDVGFYTLSYQIASVLLLVGISLNHAWRPWCMKYLSEHATSSYKKPIKLVLTMGVLMSLAAIGYGSLAPLIFKPWLPETYQVAFTLVPIMSLSAALYCTIHYISPFYLHLGQTRAIGKTIFFASIMNIVLNVVLIPEYGAWGAALSTLISTALSIIALFARLRHCPKPKTA
ncbi:MAG: oligosaccharide flippase family protein [Pseudomonadota bacterium]|nr:oligosaccharide flippase family protein [Pseudomonadota bacterium]